MHKAISAVLILAAALAASPLATPSPSPAPKHPASKHTPAPKRVIPVSRLATPPPEIVRTVSRPFCSALRNSIGPTIGTLLQNDNIIRSGPKLFDDFNRANGNGDMSSGTKDLTLVKMENMVGPLVGNIASIEKLLQNPAVYHVPPRSAEEKKLLDMREELYQALAMQKASLDIVNGFVTTQQLGEIQHVGEGIVGQINGDVDQHKMMGTATPDPLTNDPNAAGLKQDPHFIDPATIPGLSLGYNPITRLNEGLRWTQAQAADRENAAAPHVWDAIRLCGGVVKTPAPAATKAP